MATFPAIAPTSRVYTPGDVPRALQESLSGLATGYRRGNRRIGQTLSLNFDYLAEAQMVQLKDHYINSNGTFNIFFLSAEIWGDFNTPPVPLLSDFAWRYTSEPVITDASYNRYSIAIELQTVPIDTGDLIFDGLTASLLPEREYILEAGGAAASPARDYIISPTGAV